jgi:hypothetical protein
MREIEAACSELVEINAAMFARENDQYLAALFPETVKHNGNGQQGRKDTDADDPPG